MLKALREAAVSQEGAASGSFQITVTSPPESKSPAPTAQHVSQTTNPVLGPAGRGPSLLGLLAAKRFTRNLRNKYRRSGSLYGSSRHSNSIQIKREPTYRMEPKHKFNAEEVEEIIKAIIDQRMGEFRYHPKFCSNICKILSDEIKDGVKKLKYDRYKIVAVVHIGERRDQSTVVASRCAWDKKFDNFATYKLENATLFCTASVFGIYNE